MGKTSSFGNVRTYLICLALVAGPFVAGSVMKGRRDVFAGLYVENSNLDFGETPPIKDFRWEVPITNSTASVVEILGFEKSCHCSTVAPETLTLAPGEKSKVTVTLDLLPKKDDDLATPVREFAATIRALCKGGSPKPEPWQLTGRIVNSYRIDPPYLSFGNSLVKGTMFEAREVIVVCPPTVSSLRIRCEPPNAVLEVVESKSKNGVFVLRVSVNESLPIGNHEMSVVIEGLQSDHETLPEGRIRVFARVVGDIEILPTVVHFGAHHIGKVAEMDVSLASRTGAPFEFLGLESPSEGLRVEPGQQTKGESLSVKFKQEINSSGSSINSLRFLAKSSLDGETCRIPVTVCYTGLEH